MNRRTLLRSAVLLPGAGLAGCTFLDDLLQSDKDALPGRREPVLAGGRGMVVDATDQRPVVLPPPVLNADWTQPGGVPSHAVGNIALNPITRSWRRSIGEGGGYRRKVTGAPVIANGRIYTMDSDAAVSSFSVADGSRAWRTDTQDEKDRSTNVGGGLALAGDTVFASTGRAEVLALQAATGKILWRSGLDSPARSAPTVVDGKVFVPTLDGRLLALATADGKRLWSYQASTQSTVVLGEPAPAFSDGFVVAGFGSGDLVCLRADSGTLAWSDSLAAARGRNSLLDLSAVRALPVITGGAVFAIGVGGLMVSIDLRSGRRLWEREIGGQNAPAIAGDWVFVLGLDQILACIGRVDGRVRWISQLPRFANAEKQRDPIFWTGPLLGGKYIYLAGSTEKLLAVNPADGAVLGQEDLAAAPSTGLVAAGGKLFVLTDDGSLTAFG